MSKSRRKKKAKKKAHKILIAGCKTALSSPTPQQEYHPVKSLCLAALFEPMRPITYRDFKPWPKLTINKSKWISLKDLLNWKPFLDPGEYESIYRDIHQTIFNSQLPWFRPDKELLLYGKYVYDFELEKSRKNLLNRLLNLFESKKQFQMRVDKRIKEIIENEATQLEAVLFCSI